MKTDSTCQEERSELNAERCRAGELLTTPLRSSVSPPEQWRLSCREVFKTYQEKQFIEELDVKAFRQDKKQMQTKRLTR